MKADYRNIPKFLTLKEVAELVRLKPRTIYEMVAQNRIPYRKAGRVLIFELGEIVEWKKNNNN